MTNLTKRVPKIFSTTSVSEIINIYLSDDIGPPEDYTEEIQALKDAKEGDTVFIFINNGGGHIRTALQFEDNIKSCRATVVGCIEVECHSAATYIFLACDEWQVANNSFMLIHNYSSGSYGKGSDLVQNVVETDKWIWSTMKDMYIPFLSEQELSDLGSKDIYLRAEEIKSRLKQVVEHRELNLEIAREEQLELTRKHLKGFMKNEEQNYISVEERSS